MAQSIETGATVPHPTFPEALRVWLRIGLLSFGGPAGQIALMHKELVEEKRWISEDRFLHGLNFCMFLPGPEAMQLATYVGWRLHGTKGGIAAGLLFVIPGFCIILALSIAYALFQGSAWFASLFFGLKAAVLAVVLEALFRVARKSLKGKPGYVLACASFLALFAFDIPFPVVILAAGLIGYFCERQNPGWLSGTVKYSQYIEEKSLGGFAHALWTILVWGTLWAIPIVAISYIFGGNSVYMNIAVFFSKMAVVTFGGAYAVLAYVAQAAVQDFGWLKPGQMIDGLALAETTPGPLILVLAYVGFLAAFQNPSGVSPLLGGVIGAALTTWVTFVPCFLWIFLGAPYIEKLRQNRALSGALAAIGAAVTGVILNLTVWFALQTLFAKVNTVHFGPLAFAWPEAGSLDVAALGLAIVAVFALFRLKLGMIPVLGLCAALGVVIKLLM